MTLLISALAFIFILGAAVIIHEFGHFIVAKLFKIRVETFSFGFGPRLVGAKWGPTDYRVSAIPLGGYVKLGGDESNAPIEGQGASDIPIEEQFNLRPRWQKILVALAGPVANILTALSIPFASALMYGVPVPPAPVVERMQSGGAAETAGLQKGDRIVWFNGQENPSWNVIRGDALLSPGKPLELVIERDGQRIRTTITPARRTEGTETFGDLEFQPDYGTVAIIIRDVVSGSPAEKAGLRTGDRIIALNSEPAASVEYVRQYIRERSEPITMTVERDGQRVDLIASERLPDGTLGFYPGEVLPLQPVGPISAAGFAVSSNVEILRLTGKALGQLFTGQRSARDTLAGPIGIARASSTAVAVAGLAGVFSMLAFLSLSLGIFNLLPIPVLDGGAIFMLLVEGVLDRLGIGLSTGLRERIQQVGFVVLLLLMAFVISNDLIKEASFWRSRPAVEQK